MKQMIKLNDLVCALLLIWWRNEKFLNRIMIRNEKWIMIINKNNLSLQFLKKFMLLIKLLKSCLHWIAKAQLNYKYLVIISEIEHVEHNN